MKSNRLISEKSPYLLQHAHNPVDWYPWGDEAFEKARKEDKPIFLSIGYSTCHWCHVMEKESFENPEVARLMNETVVSIKVDREERPDLDSIYMTICQAMTGSGGWPMSIVITPDKKPFIAATYIPRESRFGLVGMLELMPRIRQMWASHKDELAEQAGQIASSFQEPSADYSAKYPDASARVDLGEDILHRAYKQLATNFDDLYGGFGEMPKFPTPHHLTFLLRYWKRTGDEKALHMVEHTLQSMRFGGIFDHIGFGFHRYSTDFKWLVPHFEKMLYDQALLAIAYTEAYQATGNEEYADTAQEMFTYVLRDMAAKAPEGGFYSAQDADSEGVEGKFYVWTDEEIRQVLPEDEADLIIQVFNVEKEGNYSDEATGKKSGANILHLDRSMSEINISINIATAIASDLNIKVEELQDRLEAARQKLFDAREKRIPPSKDDKVLTDWNGLMIAALSKAAQVFGKPEYERAARNAADFILKNMRDPAGKLYHRFRDGESAVPAFLDDYAFFTWGLIELYETTFEVSYLKEALDITDYLLRHFWDEGDGGFYLTADNAEALIFRKKEIYDGAMPSGNSVSVSNLLRLGRITGNPELEEKASQIMRAFSDTVSATPIAYTYLMGALDFAVGPASEVVIVGDLQGDDTKAMLKALRGEFIPNKVVVFRPAGVELSEIADIVDVVGYISDMPGKEGSATAYVCENYACKLPTDDVGKMLELLRA